MPLLPAYSIHTEYNAASSLRQDQTSEDAAPSWKKSGCPRLLRQIRQSRPRQLRIFLLERRRNLESPSRPRQLRIFLLERSLSRRNLAVPRNLRQIGRRSPCQCLVVPNRLSSLQKGNNISKYMRTHLSVNLTNIVCASSTIQSQIAGKVTCEGDYSHACSGCKREGDFCCNKECATIFCTEITEYCQI